VAGAVAVTLAIASTSVSARAIPDRPPADRQPTGASTPRVSPVPEAQWTAAQKDLVAKFGDSGRADNLLATLLHVPQVVEGAMPFTNYLLTQSTLGPRHTQILVLRTAWLCGSQALWATHAARAKRSGVTEAEIRRIAQGPDAPGWDAFEKTLLQTADQLYRNSKVSDATWAALSARYDLEHLMDAVETVGHFLFLGQLANSLGVQPDGGLSDRLPDVPYRITVSDPEPALTKARVDALPGPGIAVGRTFSRHAKLNAVRTLRANFINRVSKLTPRHREMFILRIGWDCQSEYEWAQHVGSVGRARDHGLDPVQVAKGPDAPGLDPFDAAIYRAVDELYRGASISAASWKALSARFDASLIMSGVYTAASYRATSMSLRTYGVQLEPTDERFPKVE
jgi:alkylhydroperoxidase family enzyme